MTNSTTFFRLTVAAVSFATREYFRPFLAVLGLGQSFFGRGKTAKTAPEDQTTLDQSQVIVREGLTKKQAR
jgi:hypothetical protein